MRLLHPPHLFLWYLCHLCQDERSAWEISMISSWMRLFTYFQKQVMDEIQQIHHVELVPSTICFSCMFRFSDPSKASSCFRCKARICSSIPCNLCKLCFNQDQSDSEREDARRKTRKQADKMLELDRYVTIIDFLRKRFGKAEVWDYVLLAIQFAPTMETFSRPDDVPIEKTLSLRRTVELCREYWWRSRKRCKSEMAENVIPCAIKEAASILINILLPILRQLYISIWK